MVVLPVESVPTRHEAKVEYTVDDAVQEELDWLMVVQSVVV